MEKNPYNLQEAKAFLEAVIDHRFRALFTLSILSGLREGEALALRWSDLDLEAGTIEVNNTLHRREGAWYFDSAKTASSNRTVSMVPLLMNVLAQHRESQRAERLLIGDYDKKDNPKGWVDSGVVFATHKGGPLLARNVLRSYTALIAKAGLRKQTYHDLRHACSRLLRESGAMSLDELSKFLGHASIQITSDFYLHLSVEAQAKSMDKLQDALTS